MIIAPFDPALRERYLQHLGFRVPPGPPSPDALRVLHHAQLNHVPYENLEIQLGRPTSIDPHESVRRIVTGRGGYCYHLNGAFAGLLVSLGYDVALVRGAAPSAGDGSAWGNHLVLLVWFPGETWLADVGMGDGFRDPVPLVDGVLDQPPFRYHLEHLDGPRWRFHHDERASFAGFDLDVTPVSLTAFAPVHERLSTSADSPFVQKLVVQLRRADHALTLRGCVLTCVDATGRSSRDVRKEDEWFGLLYDEFRLRLDDVPRDTLAALWDRVSASHDAWDRAGRP
ncbi:arylamine N-acetyltransferase family protein [Actinopolymorpha alba]|uniref:arylamine N-acetyltransferase family protein n=1 Tax=Actinopolymorpha alba TaxID=533267 RepID=UPI00035D4218|nr:arylamine N-acetyltransferase [Actinopolymorpha alba]